MPTRRNTRRTRTHGQGFSAWFRQVMEKRDGATAWRISRLHPQAAWRWRYRVGSVIARAAGGRAGATPGLPAFTSTPAPGRRPKLYDEPANAAAADGAYVSACGAADDDGLYPHHYRAVAAAPGARNAVFATQPGARGSGAVSYLFRHGPGVRQDIRGCLSTLYRQQDYHDAGIGTGSRARSRPS